MTNEIKLILIGILICHQFLFTLAINETECGDLGGCFCEGARGCFFAMKETVQTYTEAEELCASRSMILPRFNEHITPTYFQCCGRAFTHPFLFFNQPLGDEYCTTVNATRSFEFCVLRDCSFDTEVNVFCLIEF